MKCPELSKEFGDVIRFILTSIPTAAEAAEVDARADRRSPGRILSYRGKSVVAGNSKFKLANASSKDYSNFLHLRDNFWLIF